ncbi:hypothetical protein Solca_4400 [Solitalea canadensis DSM 3403]|uniref:Uncharacterized protein n=1 Tax=Solitalea canadensis (strain ATCC 29591 / DSM 3403 / JCM 21819 / LMG 8368 / NBRC 15130 / NCIMB 12057 / USAM 9D) TaxID=929556 RepID=H8KN57_SOLCM|nr:hypothetical protein Solca_4400 [Solitalea canadensis DSM 3403]
MDGPTAIRKGKKQEKPDENRALNYLNYHFNSYYFFSTSCLFGNISDATTLTVSIKRIMISE